MPQRLSSLEIENEFESCTSIAAGGVVGNTANEQLERAQVVRILGSSRTLRAVNPVTQSASARDTAYTERGDDALRPRLRGRPELIRTCVNCLY